jgi:Na+-translocating ferredoxin:NAD+ oxidoreductase RNF subunit RnfB
MEIILSTLITLSLLGLVSAIILYFVAQKFKVFEDPRIDDVAAFTPGANCGGCGYPGCRGFAEACVNAENLDNMFCPAGGNETMKNIANVLGLTAVEKAPQIAVVRCNGTHEKRRKTSVYDGPNSCAVSHALYSGDTDCPYGCLGLGDCVVVCKFDAIYIDEESGLPMVDEQKCTACNACAKACPKSIIEIRLKGKKSRRIYVSCINKDKGAEAKRACDSACIACNKCVKTCAFDAITVDNFCAYIDAEKCSLCRKCVQECPTGAILELNFPARKDTSAKTSVEVTEVEN